MDAMQTVSRPQLGIPTPAEKPSEMESVFNHLRSTQTDMCELLGRLQSRIDPILCGELKSQTADKPGLPTVRSPLANRINEAIAINLEVNRLLSSLIERVQL